jgi:hypothetical protein
MAIIESCLAVLGVASQAATVHGWFSGLKAGNHFDQLLKELQRTRCSLKRLSENILYAPSIQEVYYASGKDPALLSDPRRLLAHLSPIQKALNGQLLSTAALPTPQKLNREFCQNPWNVLIEITPIDRFRRPANPALVPIVFFDGNTHYVGWQTNGILRSSLDCEYISRPIDSERSNGLPINATYTAAPFKVAQITQEYHTDAAIGIYVQPYMDAELLKSFVDSVMKKRSAKLSADEVLFLFCDRIVKSAGLFSKVQANMIGLTSTSILWNYESTTELKFSGIESFRKINSYSDKDKGALRFIKKYIIGGGKFVFTLRGKQQCSVGFTNKKGASIFESVLSSLISSG